MSEQTKMDQITTEMTEHICDKLCRFPREMEQEELEEHCCECKMGEFMNSILNEYNDLNDFEKSEICKLLQIISGLKSQLPAFKVGDTAYIIDLHEGVIKESVVQVITSRADNAGTSCEYISEHLAFCSEDIGKEAFLSREEAEQALKEKGEREDEEV